MKILKLDHIGIKNAKAVVFKNKKNNELYFNIKHGSSKFWVWSASLDKKYYKPKNDNDVLELSENDYILIPIKGKKEVLKDKKNNTLYFISKDYMEIHKNDILLLWEIPNKNYTSVKYKVEGNASVIGTGMAGKERDNVKYTSPAPVVEILGNCKLTWEAVDVNGDKYKQEIEYKNNNFNISDIKKV